MRGIPSVRRSLMQLNCAISSEERDGGARLKTAGCEFGLDFAGSFVITAPSQKGLSL